VDAAFTAAGMPDPDKGKATPPPKETPKPASASPTKPIPTAADKAPGVPKELRAELDRVKGELKAKTDAQTALEAKIADFERRGKDTSALTERLTTLEKQMEAKDAELRALKQEASPAFKAKYDVPFNRMADRAKSVVEQIQVEDTETGTTRTATWGEFTKIYGLSEFIATKEAKRLFGDDGGQIAMGYYRQLHELDDTRKVALDEERTQWKQKDEQERAQRVQSEEQIHAFWNKANQELAEKYEDYHDSPDDKELADARSKALSIYDAQPKTLKDRIIKDAHNRQRVAAVPVLKLKLARAEKALAEVKAELDGYKEKPPGPGSRPGGTPNAAAEESFENYIRKSVTA
jgi:hypothetical protein